MSMQIVITAASLRSMKVFTIHMNAPLIRITRDNISSLSQLRVNDQRSWAKGNLALGTNIYIHIVNVVVKLHLELSSFPIAFFLRIRKVLEKNFFSSFFFVVRMCPFFNILHKWEFYDTHFVFWNMKYRGKYIYNIRKKNVHSLKVEWWNSSLSIFNIQHNRRGMLGKTFWSSISPDWKI